MQMFLWFCFYLFKKKNWKDIILILFSKVKTIQMLQKISISNKLLKESWKKCVTQFPLKY